MLYKAFISYSRAADSELAPALQSSLHRFAKPWYKRRAVNTFRDATNLSVNPGVWSSILKALRDSEYFLLLASPLAAGSPWVQREVEFWRTNRPPEKLLVILTEGNIVWDDTSNDFDWKHTDALPRSLSRVFQEEPLYLDFRWARTVTDLSLKNPTFLDKMADLAATLHGKFKNDIIGEEVYQQKRTKTLAWSAASLLVLLTLAATTAAFIAYQQRQVAIVRQKTAQAKTAFLSDPEESLRLAIDAVLKTRSTFLFPSDVANEAREALNTAVQASHVTHKLLHRTPYSKGRPEQYQVQDVAFDRDGKRAATASSDGTVKVWDLTSKRFIKSLKHQGMVWTVAFDNQGRYLASAGEGPVIVWDAASLQERFRLPKEDPKIPGIPGTVFSVAFSPNGQYLATATGDGNVRVWNTDTAELVRTLRVTRNDCPTGAPQCIARRVAFSGDGNCLAAAGYTGEAKVWSIGTTITAAPVTNERRATGAHDWVMGIGVNVNCTTLATSGNDTMPRIWEINDHGIRQIANLVGHTNSVLGITFSPNGQYIATTGYDSQAKVWNASGRELFSLLGHKGKNVSIRFSPDGARLATASEDGTARVWSFDRRMVHFSSDRPAARSGDHRRSTILYAHFDKVTTLAFSREGTKLATAGVDGTVRIWDIPSHSLRCQASTSPNPVYRLAFSADGKRIVTAGQEGGVWDSESCKDIIRIKTDGTIRSISFGKNDLLATGTTDGRVALWSALGHKELEIKAHNNQVLDVGFSPDGNKLVSTSIDRVPPVKLWNTSNLEPLREQLDESQYTVFRASFSPDGRLLATASEDGTAKVWDLASRNPIVFEHTDSVTAVAFSPDGRLFASGGRDMFLKVWNVATRQLLLTFQSTAIIQTIAFAPDGKQLVVAGDDGIVRFLYLDIDEILALARSQIVPPTLPSDSK